MALRSLNLNGWNFEWMAIYTLDLQNQLYEPKANPLQIQPPNQGRHQQRKTYHLIIPLWMQLLWWWPLHCGVKIKSGGGKYSGEKGEGVLAGEYWGKILRCGEEKKKWWPARTTVLG